MMKKLNDLLSPEARRDMREPIERAKTFPPAAYFKPEFYQYELIHVLRESWVAVSFSTCIPDSGDVEPMVVLECPVFLVRDQAGVLRAYHNVCAYDGCEVVINAQRGADQIVTPYHGWQYGFDGRLVCAEYWDGTPESTSIDVRDLKADLIPIPVTEWMGTIFLYLGNHPVPFDQQYSAVLTHLEKIALDELEIGENEDGSPMVSELPIRANWKTVYENYSPNVYHESFVHAMYKRSPHSPRVDKNGVKTYTEINHPSGYLGLCYDNKIGASLYGETRLPEIRNKDGSRNSINTIANAFPNWVTTMLGDAARISIFLPDGPELGMQKVATFFHKSGSRDPALSKDREHAMKMGILARKEDNQICESVQRARHSPVAKSQFYNPFWDAMHYTLNNLILDKLEAGEAAEDG